MATDFESKYKGQVLEDILSAYTEGTLGVRVYTTTFDWFDLISGEDINADLANKGELLHSIQGSCLICVPINKNLGRDSGYIMANCFAEDLLYITLVYGKESIQIETGYGDYDDGVIHSEQIFFSEITDVVQSDWNESNPESMAFILNRTHYFSPYSSMVTLPATDSSVGTSISVVGEAFILNGNAYNASHVVGMEIECSVAGPSVVVRVDYTEGEGYTLYHVSGTPAIDIPFWPAGRIIPISDGYLPETVVRKNELGKVNGKSLLEGDVTLEVSSIQYVAQSLTEEQKEQARKNIGAVSQGELQKMYNELLALIQGGVVTPTQAVLDEAVLS